MVNGQGREKSAVREVYSFSRAGLSIFLSFSSTSERVSLSIQRPTEYERVVVRQMICINYSGFQDCQDGPQPIIARLPVAAGTVG
jgi:hypothetical protein